MKKLVLVPLVSLLSACSAEKNAQNTEAEAVEADGAMAVAAVAAAADECPVLDSRDWSAWINAMPSVGGGKSLHVAGEVDLPTPGYTISWTLGPADRAMPPGQRLKLTATPPDGMVTQVVTAELVKYEGEALYPEYRSVIVSCGDKVLAEITDVPTVQ